MENQRIEYKSNWLETVIDIVKEVDPVWIWSGFGMVVLTTAITILTLFIVKDKPIRGYYLSRQGEAGIEYSCVYSDINWSPDSLSFCTADTDKAVRLVKELNDSLR